MKFQRWLTAGCLALGALALAPAGYAEPTEIIVRVLARGGKFIGTSMGGAEVVVRDAASGQVLARGTTEGGTGATPG